MAFFRICPGCGSNLDPGETCECSRWDKPEHQQAESGGVPLTVYKHDPDCRRRYEAAREQADRQRRLSYASK